MTKYLLCIFILAVVFCPYAFGQKTGGETPANNESVPVSYGIVVDNSGSYRTMLEKIISLTKDLAEENRADDETFLVSFIDSNKIRLLEDFTSSKQAIHDAADDMYIEGGQTAIVDAVEYSARYFAEKAQKDPNRSRAMILITDGDERQSETKLDAVIAFLKTENIRVYVIGLSDEKVYTKLIDKIARGTGGKVYLPKTRAELPDVVKEVSVAIRTKTANGK